jgi:glycosyltransferase involved in cell wall biosynthesis
VAQAEAGITVPPDDPAALAEAMLALAKFPLSERQAMGARGREHVLQHHSFGRLAKKLHDTLEEVLAEQRASGTARR